MRKLLKIVILVAFISAPALANITETFDTAASLTAWAPSGNVTWDSEGGNGFAILGLTQFDGSSRLRQDFSVGAGGEWMDLTFQYSFQGIDISPGDDYFRVKTSVVNMSDGLVFELASGGNLSPEWQAGAAVPNPFLLAEGDYTLRFNLVEPVGGANFTALLLDDIVLTGTSAANVIPAPGALLLGSMGMGIVGWLRRRRMM